ncbi:conserved hypothetical protein [Paraglaciecola sp. T6c]|uniref:FAD/NAD(P)-binding protein n=1 Tax=Pseudoalteromonas atlantica (strain T6c / ATCC BAA-1087) TaxID=3042615 RepID=UPI00005C6C24|nr:FAD/NAD(P)-binding protein [Paraglaciecola sp. T6c]ABG38738.1 conserved hypothetical protein [Paraglaciecola sp. T6c]
MSKIRIALIGGGPSALTIIKKLLSNELGQEQSQGASRFSIDIFERNSSLGKGMPYSEEGASTEHITNISSDELAPFDETLAQWLGKQSHAYLARHDIDKANLHVKHVIPRLLFGDYLNAQFDALIRKGASNGLNINLHVNSEVLDIKPSTNSQTSDVHTVSGWIKGFHKVIICTGHAWPRRNEGNVAGYFDSPYPPIKLQHKYNHAVALKGSSLTAIDAIRTLSKANGHFYHDQEKLKFKRAQDVPDFKIVMHSLDGLLPNIRFHLDDPLVSEEGMLTEQQIAEHRAENDGFLSLDFTFEHNFKKVLAKRDNTFYQKIANKNLEQFTDWMLESRKAFDPFTLFKIECIQAEQSIKHEQTLQWKEVLALLSFTINHPAKYLSGEDTLRLQQKLLPLIGLMIANIPQASAVQLLALYESKALEVISVDTNSNVQIEGDHCFTYHYENSAKQSVTEPYQIFVDCTGQKHLPMADFPFTSMFDAEPVLPACVRFKEKAQGQKQQRVDRDNVSIGADGEYYLTLKGFAINDAYQPILATGKPSERYFLMAVPFISGFNPDYSGFDFCEQVSTIIVEKLCAELPQH